MSITIKITSLQVPAGDLGGADVAIQPIAIDKALPEHILFSMDDADGDCCLFKHGKKIVYVHGHFHPFKKDGSFEAVYTPLHHWHYCAGFLLFCAMVGSRQGRRFL